MVRLTLVLLVALSGCAGHQAMIWKPQAPPVEQCKIPVCEKINPHDKRCWREYCAG